MTCNNTDRPYQWHIEYLCTLQFVCMPVCACVWVLRFSYLPTMRRNAVGVIVLCVWWLYRFRIFSSTFRLCVCNIDSKQCKRTNRKLVFVLLFCCYTFVYIKATTTHPLTVICYPFFSFFSPFYFSLFKWYVLIKYWFLSFCTWWFLIFNSNTIHHVLFLPSTLPPFLFRYMHLQPMLCMGNEIEHGKLKWEADYRIEYQTEPKSKSSHIKVALYSNHLHSFSQFISQSAVLFIASWIDMFIDMLYTLHSLTHSFTQFKTIENSTGQKLNKRCIISSSENARFEWMKNKKKWKKFNILNVFVLAYFIHFQREKSAHNNE